MYPIEYILYIWLLFLKTIIMRKSMIIFSIALVGLTFQSCKKKIYGCMDETATNYSPVATEDGMDCIYDKVVVSNTLSNIAWTAGTNQWIISLDWPDITQDVINNGAVSTYLGQDGEWIELPFTTIVSTSYSTIITATYSLGNVYIVYEDSDGVMPIEPSPADFKVVIFK